MVNRKKLDDIIKINGGDNWWKPELFLQTTIKILPGELQVIENPPEYSKNYNCFIYALGLKDNQELINDCGGFIYDTFIFKLLKDGLLNYTKQPTIGDYVIYRDLKNYPQYITHIGILDRDKRIISKWAWGPLIKHQILDVPLSYGNDIKYLKNISPTNALNLYHKYKKFNIKPE